MLPTSILLSGEEGGIACEPLVVPVLALEVMALLEEASSSNSVPHPGA